MSLVAALLVGSSAFAIENTKVSGNANLFYSTTQDTTDLFDKAGSAADASVNLNITTDLTKNDTITVSAGAGATVLSTLGLEQNLVNSVFGGAHGITGNTSSRGAYVNSAAWMNEAWVAATVSNTTAKLGRMELDTPLAFTETWSIEKNTFEAIVAINTDLPDTTLVGAYVGNGNGTESLGATSMAQGAVAIGAVVNEDGKFDTYGKSGAYAAGVINNSWKPLTVQAWYYNVVQVADAFWLQADFAQDGIMAGAQYTAVTAKGGDADNVYALMVGYEMKDTFTAKLSYSAVNDSGSIGYAGFNTATSAGTAQSKLYTEAWWNYGVVTKADTKAFNLTVEAPVKDIVDLGLYATMASTSVDNVNDLTEITMTASHSFGSLDTSAAVIYADKNDNKSGMLQAYLTYNF